MNAGARMGMTNYQKRPPKLLAEIAVERDLFKRALEDRQLFIVKLVDEQLATRARERAPSPSGERCPVGQRNDHGARIRFDVGRQTAPR